MNGHEKVLLPAYDQSKFHSGDCFIFQYSYPGEDKEEYLIGTWFGKQSVEVIKHSLTVFFFLSIPKIVECHNAFNHNFSDCLFKTSLRMTDFLL